MLDSCALSDTYDTAWVYSSVQYIPNTDNKIQVEKNEPNALDIFYWIPSEGPIYVISFYFGVYPFY